VEIATIGFTKSSAESFFGRVTASGIRRLGDVRLRNTSQLAGFAKKDDLAYFLARLCGAEYVELPLLAPEDHTLDAYRGGTLPWAEYERRYIALLDGRNVTRTFIRSEWEPGIVFLCSEDQPDRCHRRLAAEYFEAAWADISIRHL
jgi:uncharacterized protein (DUF488 family)